MVLQQKQAVPIWGWADPGESVTVTFAGQSKTVITNKSGKFMVKLDAMPANATPQDLQIGNVKLTDILIGEVWLCSGQSNMEYAFRPEKEVKYGNDMVRMFHVHDHVRSSFAMEDTNGAWNSFKDGNSHRFSGVGLYFGMKLQKELGVPVGLIDASWGGTAIEWWIADEGYALIGKPLKKADMTAVIKQQDKVISDVEAWLTKAKQASSVGRVNPFTVKTTIGGNSTTPWWHHSLRLRSRGRSGIRANRIAVVEIISISSRPYKAAGPRSSTHQNYRFIWYKSRRMTTIKASAQ